MNPIIITHDATDLNNLKIVTHDYAGNEQLLGTLKVRSLNSVSALEKLLAADHPDCEIKTQLIDLN